jgi:hypothetical protein
MGIGRAASMMPIGKNILTTIAASLLRNWNEEILTRMSFIALPVMDRIILE